MFYRFSRAVLFWRDFAGEVYCSCALGGAESLNFACFKALTSIFYASEYASRRGFDERDADLL